MPTVLESAGAIFGSRLELAQRYAELLTTTGMEWGLIGPREADIVWPRHLLNSAGLAGLIAPDRRVADIGSGAGLPGIPLALARPDLALELVEPMQRRIDFLALVVAELGLEKQVRLVRARAEDYGGRPDVVVCRALAPVAVLVGWLGRLVPPAELLALKGQRAEMEVAAAKEALTRAGLVASVQSMTIGDSVVGRAVVVTAAPRR